MGSKKAKRMSALVIGLTIALQLSVGAGAALCVTAADIDLLLTLGLMSKEEAAAAKANLGRPSLTTKPAVSKENPSIEAKSTAPKGYPFTRDLQIGSRGADVTALQNLLGISPTTGHFGALTKAAVIKYQMDKKISPATGYVGAKTRALLNAAAGAGGQP